MLNYIDSLGESDALPLQSLSWKLAMILALTRPSRSADIAMLDLRYRRYTPEGVVFQEAVLAKQSKQGKPRAEFFFLAFSNNARTLSTADTAGIQTEDRALPNRRK